jgi:hypothetical protein
MAIARTAVGAATLNGLLYGVGGECAVPAAMVLNDGNANPPPHANVHLGKQKNAYLSRVTTECYAVFTLREDIPY